MRSHGNAARKLRYISSRPKALGVKVLRTRREEDERRGEDGGSSREREWVGRRLPIMRNHA